MAALKQITFESMHENFSVVTANEFNNKAMLFFAFDEGNKILISPVIKNSIRQIRKSYTLKEIESIAELNMLMMEHGFFVITDNDEFEALKHKSYDEYIKTKAVR